MKTKTTPKKKKPRATGIKLPKTPVIDLSKRRDNSAAIAMLDRWAKEPPEEEVVTLKEFKAALERNRGGRRLF